MDFEDHEKNRRTLILFMRKQRRQLRRAIKSGELPVCNHYPYMAKGMGTVKPTNDIEEFYVTVCGIRLGQRKFVESVEPGWWESGMVQVI